MRRFTAEMYSEMRICSEVQIVLLQTEFKLHDVRRFEKYMELVESKEEFGCGKINLLYSIFSDGAAFSKISRYKTRFCIF